MSRPVGSAGSAVEYITYSQLTPDQKSEMLSACHDLTGRIYEGLDVALKIRAVDQQHLGDTILLSENSKIVGLAVCHVGSRTEAGSGACYAKFAAVRPEHDAPETFNHLLDACDKFASSRGVERFVTGVNMSHHEACRAMIARGFRTDLQLIALHRDNDPGYSRPGIYVLDDWR